MVHRTQVYRIGPMNIGVQAQRINQISEVLTVDLELWLGMILEPPQVVRDVV